MTDNFKQKLKQKNPMVGILQTLPYPEITEILVSTGFDWLFVDMEHSVMDVPLMQHILVTAHNRCPCIVRSPSHDEVWLKKILDAGADGVIVPQVNSAEQAERIVGLCKYSPEGRRSVGISRAHGYGMKFKEYVENANNQISVVLQIEHIDGVKNIDSIVKVPGIDALFIGPYDLSASMGKIGRVNDPDVQQNIERVRNTCLEAGLTTGIFTANPEEVKTLAEKGYTLIAMGIDALFMGQSLRQALDKAGT